MLGFLPQHDCRMKPFQDLVLGFAGFSREEESDMEKTAVENGTSVYGVLYF